MFGKEPKFTTIVDYPGANKAQEDKLNQYSIKYLPEKPDLSSMSNNKKI